jgi:hypothetical protein
MKLLRAGIISFPIAAIVAFSSCSVNLSRFDTYGKGPASGRSPASASYVMPKAELADQGSGEASAPVGPLGHNISRVTLGGSYLRRAQITDTSGLRKLDSGFHADSH